jgi:hypothetical protein
MEWLVPVLVVFLLLMVIGAVWILIVQALEEKWRRTSR